MGSVPVCLFSLEDSLQEAPASVELFGIKEAGQQKREWYFSRMPNLYRVLEPSPQNMSSTRSSTKSMTLYMQHRSGYVGGSKNHGRYARYCVSD